MSASPRSPRLNKCGLVQLDPTTGVVQRVLSLQYNPDSLSRSLQIRDAGEEAGDRSEALRLTGPPVETFKFEAELDATDDMAEAEAGASKLADISLHNELAALEALVYPSSTQVSEHKTLAEQGSFEIAPAEAPLLVFVWGPKRVLPVRITELSITEEAFDPELNPIRAKVSLSLRVLSAQDLGFDHRGSSLFAVHHQSKELLAAAVGLTSLSDSSLGIAEIVT